MRTRLTLWYVAILSGVLALYAGSSLLFLHVSLRRELDRNLSEEFERVEDLLAAAPDGSIRMGGHGGDGELQGVVEAWSTDRRLLYRSEGLGGQALGGPPTAAPTESPFASVELGDWTPLRVLSRPHEVMGRSVLVRVALSEETLRAEWHRLMFGLLIGSILEEADRLTLLVDTLLSLSRADAGDVPLHREDVDLLALAREVAAHLGVLAEEKEQALAVAGSEPVLVHADRLVLRQALVNVVDNAIKYSPPGSRVRVVVTGDAATGRIDIVDEGPGIPLAHRERIFERFYRVDKGRSREQGGAGLGLSLAHWAVTAHGGRIDVESAEGEGSTFRISLPRQKPSLPAQSE